MEEAQMPSLGQEAAGVAPTPAFLPRESHGQRNLAGDSPRGHRGPDATQVAEHTGTHTYKSLLNKTSQCFPDYPRPASWRPLIQSLHQTHTSQPCGEARSCAFMHCACHQGLIEWLLWAKHCSNVVLAMKGWGKVRQVLRLQASIHSINVETRYQGWTEIKCQVT